MSGVSEKVRAAPDLSLCLPSQAARCLRECRTGGRIGPPLQLAIPDLQLTSANMARRLQAADIPMQDYEIELSILPDEFFGLIHIFFGTDEERDALVKVAGHDIQDVHFTVRCPAAGLLDHHRQW